MPLLPLNDRALRYDITGDGAPVVLLPPLGCPALIWDGIALPDHRVLRPTFRGAAMGALVRDVEVLMETLDLRDAVVVGAGLGGLVAQGLAVKRLDLVRGMVLMNTAARIPATGAWREAQVAATSMDPLVEPTVARGFPPAARQGVAATALRAMLRDGDPAIYAAGAAAIRGTDFYTTTATLTLPTLILASDGDAITPPDLVRETADLIAGSEFRLLRGSGHFPMLDAADEVTAHIRAFLTRISH